MGKKKNKLTADQVRNKRKGQDKKINPFEVKINRQKHDVLGRKITKFEKGMPGVSRAKAIKRRKATLLKEYEQQFRKNRFVDKRFGEHDTSLSLEEKMMKRYAMERAKTGGKNKFSLNEEEELTHYGQSLAEIEKFDEPFISDEDEDDDDRRAAAKLVAQEHFGGFLQKKNPEDEKKSWKERMEEMIKESKKKKHEKQMEKEETLQMTEQLDEQWKSLHSLLSKNRMKGKQEEDMKKSVDDYDIAVRTLQFESKGQATDRLKSEEELAREEKERLESLEADRIRRMKGLSEEDAKPQPKHRSADDLDDGFAIEPQDFDYVSYKDGKLNEETGEDMKADEDSDNDDEDEEMDSDAESGENKSGEDDEEEISDDGGDDDKATDDDDDVDDENADDDSDDDDEKEESASSNDEVKKKKTSVNKLEKVKAGKQKNEEDDVEDSDDNSSEESDDYKDIKSDQEDEEGEEIVGKESRQADSKQRKLMMEKAKKELPYTFKAPENYDDLLDMLEGHSMEDQLTVITRIRKCHHPSLVEGNKQKLEALFSYLVEFYCDLCVQDPPQLDFVDKLVTHLYELTQMSPDNSASVILENLMERQTEFAHICDKKAGRGLYPGLDTLMLFKLVSLLFPTSDFRHPVTTPTLLFMCQILGQSPVNTERDIVAGLLLCNLCLEYVTMSKRYIPEVITFLHGLLFYAADKDPKKIESVIPPFKPVGNVINLLKVDKKVKSSVTDKWSLSEMLAPEVDENLYKTDGFSVTALCQCFKLLSEFKQLYKDLAAFNEIFKPVLCMCRKLPTFKYPPELQTMITEFTASSEELCQRSRTPLVMQKKKPKPLKMFEPKVEEKFDGRKKGKRGTKDFNEKQKLMHKYKKEMKGAVRELKKDTRFLARQKLQETMDRDAERKRKVKELMGDLAQQEGDYKKMKRGIKPE